MKPEKQYRINGFEQMKAFYSWVFNNQDKARPTHMSLYGFLLNQANRSNWVEWFKCPYDLAMQGACIGNNGTYYRCLDDLQNWGLIKYQKGINNYKAPLIHLICLYDSEQLTEQVTVPLSEQVTAQQTVQLTEQVTVHIYNVLTNNLKRITDNLPEVVGFLDELEKVKTVEIDYSKITEVYHQHCSTLPKVMKLTKGRKEHILARIKEYKPGTVEEVLKAVGSSEFLTGSNERGWKADFDWIISPVNFLKILEGKYNKAKPNPQQQTTKTNSLKDNDELKP